MQFTRAKPIPWSKQAYRVIHRIRGLAMLAECLAVWLAVKISADFHEAAAHFIIII